MKLLVVSDSHGDRAILEQLVDQFSGQIDGWFHCGDSELPADDPLWQIFHVVGGNMDFDPQYPEQLLIPMAQQRIFLTHGHRYQIKLDLTALALAAKQERATMVFFGHSHELGLAQNNGALFLNPGSISQPRGEFAKLGGTFAIVSVSGQQCQVDFHTRDGQIVSELTTTLTMGDIK